MTKQELKKGYSIFGNKGAVWNNSVHISQDNSLSGRTLCGTPMLSTNWARIENIDHIGCEECLKVYLGSQN